MIEQGIVIIVILIILFGMSGWVPLIAQMGGGAMSPGTLDQLQSNWPIDESLIGDWPYYGQFYNGMPYYPKSRYPYNAPYYSYMYPYSNPYY